MKSATFSGFSKLSKEEKIHLVASKFFKDPKEAAQTLKSFWHTNTHEQKIFDEFSENTLTNFYLPFGVAPNFCIDGKVYCIPMVIEESSVVAAAAKSAKFWLDRGGFHTEVVSTLKVGQVHFLFQGNKDNLHNFFLDIRPILLQEVKVITSNMIRRGGGIQDLTLVDKTAEEKGYYQLKVTFETCDAMGANFINSVLEKFASVLVESARKSPFLLEQEKNIQVIMSILSNYTPECLVKCWVEAPISQMELSDLGDCSPEEFAEKFAMAIKMAKIDIYRATTHNKGIFNGVDAVVLATGNDFRAVEACGHAYACRNGRYEGLTDISLENGIFRFSMEIPLSLGTVGGLTSLHPLSKTSLELLGNPHATDLMRIVACVGLAQNFAAVCSLVTTGIQKGHMKMHLLNILNHLEATEEEREAAKDHFAYDAISFMAIRNFLQSLRKLQ